MLSMAMNNDHDYDDHEDEDEDSLQRSVNGELKITLLDQSACYGKTLRAPIPNPHCNFFLFFSILSFDCLLIQVSS